MGNLYSIDEILLPRNKGDKLDHFRYRIVVTHVFSGVKGLGNKSYNKSYDKSQADSVYFMQRIIYVGLNRFLNFNKLQQLYQFRSLLI